MVTEIDMSKDTGDSLLTEVKFTNTISTLQTLSKISELVGKTITSQAVIDASSSFIKYYSYSNSISNSLAESALSLKSIFEKTGAFYKSFSESAVSSIGETLKTALLTNAPFENAAALTAAVSKIDWSWLTEDLHLVVEKEREENAKESDNVEVTEEIRAEIASDITEIFSDPESIRETSHSKYLQWKERNPGQAAFFIEMLLPIIAIFISIICLCVDIWTAHPTKSTKVYEEPSSSSNVVYNINIEQEVTVIGVAPYYHEVEFVIPETGETMTGYVYKGNLVATESDVSTERIEQSERVLDEPNVESECAEILPETNENEG